MLDFIIHIDPQKLMAVPAKIIRIFVGELKDLMVCLLKEPVIFA